MRFSIIAAVSALAATAFAQSISDLPTCSQSCVTSGFAGSGCSQVDIACICKSQSYISGLSCCVATNCNAADQATTASFAAMLCKAVGVTGLPTTASCANGTSAATNSTTGTSTSSSSMSSGTAASSTTSAASTATATRNAAENLAQGMGFGALAAGVAAFLL